MEAWHAACIGGSGTAIVGAAAGSVAECSVVSHAEGKTGAALAARVGRAVAVVFIAGFACCTAGALEVKISGLEPTLEDNVRKYLSIAELAGKRGEESERLTAQRLRRLNREAPEQIKAALEPFGYYAPTIDASLERQNGEWVASYRIDPGEPTVLTQVQIEVLGEGRDAKPVRDALAAITIKPGDVLNHPRYEAAKQQLTQAAYDAGYIDASYERSELLVRPDAHEAQIHLVLDTGPRYYFGKVQIEQDILDPSFVSRYVSIEPGSPFDSDRLLGLQQELSDSGYFNTVTVDVRRSEVENHRIPVVVHTTPRKTQEYTVGFGYGTDTGPRVSLGLDLRRLNRRGHRFRADLRISYIEQAVAAEYQIPVQDVATDYLAYRVGLGTQKIGDWDTQQLALGLRWHNEWRGLQRSIYGTAQRERYATSLSEPETANMLFSGIQLGGQQADDPIYPRRGYSWLGDFRAGTVQTGASFTRLRATGNVVRGAGERLRILLRAELGAIGTPDFGDLPPSQRFYAGGEGSVRGYAYQSLSPSGPQGDSLGGKYLITASAEADVLIVGNYGAAVFYDVGNAWNSGPPDVKRGAGVGMRWKSPVGMIGIDIAHPFDDPTTNWRLHVSVGGEL